MPERLNGTVSKTVVWETVPRVRIPLSPPPPAEALAKAGDSFQTSSLRSLDWATADKSARRFFRRSFSEGGQLFSNYLLKSFDWATADKSARGFAIEVYANTLISGVGAHFPWIKNMKIC